MTEKTIVKLNRDIGCHLLTFLDGMDAINVIEALNDSEPFHSIAKISDYHFIQLINQFRNHQRILLPRALFHCFMDEYEIDDRHLILVSKRYSSVIEPSERLYIHPCFSVEGFLKLCEVYKTPLFKCYSRLIPFNTVWYPADFCLLDYELYAHTIGSERMLNDHEKNLFKVNAHFNGKKNQDYLSHLPFVSTINEFKENLATRFSSATWLQAIDFSQFAIVGGCVLNALCQSPFPDTNEQDINLIYYSDDLSNFHEAVKIIIDKLNRISSSDLTRQIVEGKFPGISCYNIVLPCYIQLNISMRSARNSKNPLSYILHTLDTDVSQVAFTGNKIVSTFPFLEALATNSFIVYNLQARSPKHVCMRIGKYCNRGFTFLEPIAFDGNFQSLMEQEETPWYRVENYRYTDEDGETRIGTKEFRRSLLHNVDTYRLQEKFISASCPELLQYE